MNNEWKVHFLQNTSTLKKSIETEAVFKKREMNNERNVKFLQNISYVQKVSRLKLYLLLRQKETMNETLIFFRRFNLFQRGFHWL